MSFIFRATIYIWILVIVSACQNQFSNEVYAREICEMGICDGNASCDDSTGKVKCTCKVGYTGDGYSCDINECETGDYSCQPNSVCVNLPFPEKYTCQCLEGYVDVDKTCAPEGCEDVIKFNDKELERIIRFLIAREKGLTIESFGDKIYFADLARISAFPPKEGDLEKMNLTAEKRLSYGISDLSNLNCLTDLVSIDLSDNLLTQMSFVNWKGLNKLVDLDLTAAFYGNDFDYHRLLSLTTEPSAKGFNLSKLENLKRLNISWNGRLDCSEIDWGQFANLETLLTEDSCLLDIENPIENPPESPVTMTLPANVSDLTIYVEYGSFDNILWNKAANIKKLTFALRADSYGVRFVDWGQFSQLTELVFTRAVREGNGMGFEWAETPVLQMGLDNALGFDNGEKLWTGLDRLQTLRMDYVDVANLPATWTELPFLSYLSLREAGITDQILELHDWTKMPNLNQLLLDGNKITDIGIVDWRSLEKLHLLDLSSNRITHIGEVDFGAFMHLGKLDLSNNEIVVDEALLQNRSFFDLVFLVNVHTSWTDAECRQIGQAADALGEQYSGQSKLHCDSN